MSNTAFHRCQHCGSESDVSNGLTVFEGNPFCPQCGLAASEGDEKMTDDLVNMMAQNLHINNTIHTQPHDVSMPPTPQVVPQPGPIAYITQHYHHSGHLVGSLHNEPSVSDMLAAAGVDSSAMFPSQIQLFKNAQPDQRDRLIELWRIAPPKYGDQLLSKDLGNWPQTSMQHEEEAARARWEKAEQEKVKNLCTPQGPRDVAEPYIVAGYQNNLSSINGFTAAAKRGSSGGNVTAGEATDFAGTSREWWRMENQPMEHQYGVLQHMEMYGLQLDQSSGERPDEEMF